MANGESVTDAPEPPEGGGGPTPPPGPGGPPGGPPSPLLASLAGRQGQPQVSMPGPGDVASSMTMVQNAIGMLSQAMPGLAGHPMQHEVAQVISRLGKRVNQGAPTAGVQRTQMQDMLQMLGRNAARFAAMAGQQGQPPAGPPGAMPSPMPSTPLPGA